MSEQSTAAPTTLRITFAGLCLLVQDGNPGRLHVLLPGGSTYADDHGAQLYLDARHLLGAAAPEGMCAFPLHHVLIDFSFLSAQNNADTTGASVIPHLRCISEAPVERNFVDGTFPGEHVKSRITINTGRAGKPNKGGRWRLGERCGLVWMPTAIDWVIEGLPEDGFSLPLAGLNGNAAQSVLRLHPIGREIHLFVFHSPAEHLPVVLPKYPLGEPVGKPGNGVGAPHFRAFFPLVRAPDTSPIQVFVENSGTTPAAPSAGHESHAEKAEAHDSADDARHPKLPLGFDYGCMLATASARS